MKRLLIPIGVGASAYAIDKYYYASLGERLVRALYTFGSIAYDYSYGLSKYPSTDALHQACADKLLHVLMTNRGLYIKLGQAIANQGAVFPPAYQRTFAKLYDDAAVDPWHEIDSVLQRNLGPDYESALFSSFDHRPIASASIAQVHKATLKDGTPVAVKVQHDYIRKQIGVDLLVYRAISKLYERWFGIPFSFFTRYVSDQLIKEVDFVHEYNNAEELRRFLTDDNITEVYIPRNYPKLIHKQVLVSEWIDGVSLTDKQRLLDNGFNISKVLRQYLHVFGRQIFSYGFVHSDPHPGNLLVRNHHGSQQLVVLDHGLYIGLPEKFRLEYCELWKYLFALDRRGIKDVGARWGINSTDLFATMVSLRPTKELNKSDNRDFRQLLVNFLSDEAKFPLQLLFLSRTMRMMQNLNQSLGSPVNRMNLLTKEAVTALTQQNLSLGFRSSEVSLWLRTSDLWTLTRIQIGLFLSNVVFVLVRLKQMLGGSKYGGEGIEDYIEQYMKNTAESLRWH